jgi:hypothetical protein
MARLKFLLFALLVLALWASHLLLLTPAVAARAVEQAMAHAQAARPLARAQLVDRRQELQRTALKVQSSDRYSAAISGFPARTALAPEKLEPLRELAGSLAAEGIRSGLVVGYTNEVGGTFYRGAEVAQGLDPALGQAGQDGLFQEAFGAGHLWISLPVWDYRPAPVQVGSVVLGAPLLSPEGMDALVRESGLAGAGLFQGGRLIVSAGADRAALEQAAKAAQLDGASVVERGDVGNLGPLRLPLFTTAEDRRGGQAPILVASRRAVEETPYELIAIASVRPAMAALGAYQRLALMALFGLFGLSVAWTLIMGGGGAREARAAAQVEGGDPHEVQASTSEAVPPPNALASTIPDLASPAEAPPAYEASAPMEAPPEPDSSPTAEPPEGVLAPEDDSEAGTDVKEQLRDEPRHAAQREADARPLDPFEQYAPRPAFDEPPAAASASRANDLPFGPPAVPEPSPSDTQPFSEELLTTRAYASGPRPAFSPGESFSSDPTVPPPDGDNNPDATRVATIPPELLQASLRTTRGASGPRNAPAAAAAPPPPRVAAAQASPEDAHYQEVYREFVAARARCGEPADGLTYDKFVQKLRKNKEQLMQKYNCKTVRFQVYVKEGRAALKATPSRE